MARNTDDKEKNRTGFGKFFSVLEIIFAPKLVSGTINEIKSSALPLFSNLKELLHIAKKEKGSEQTVNPLEYDGKTHFRQLMVNEKITPEIYEQSLHNIYVKHWVYLICYLGALFTLIYFFFSVKEYSASTIFFLVCTVVYLRYSKQASEFREQEFLSFKEFISYPLFFFPSKARTNDYFEVTEEMIKETEKDLEQVLSEDLKLTKQELQDYQDYLQFQKMKKQFRETQENQTSHDEV